MWKLLFFILLTVASGQYLSSCKTEHGEAGTCKPFKECYRYFEIGRLGNGTVNSVLLARTIEATTLCGNNPNAAGRTENDIICCTDVDESGPDVITFKSEDVDYRGNFRKPISNVCFSKYVVVRPGVQSEAPKNAYPFMAVLIDRSRGTGSQFCGGSLIDKQHVLTAAHCFDDGRQIRNVFVYLGSHDLTKAEPNSQAFKIGTLFKHGHYSRATMNNDIAVIRLAKPVDLRKSEIKPICLADKSYEDKSYVTLAGWGSTGVGQPTSKVLRHASFMIQDNASCKRKYDELFRTGVYGPPVPVRESNLCAGSHGYDACQGDSGGPLFDQGALQQLGIVSWGVGCGTAPGVYVRVASYKKWIEKNTSAP